MKPRKPKKTPRNPGSKPKQAPRKAPPRPAPHDAQEPDDYQTGPEGVPEIDLDDETNGGE
jgi:hypothetical protein